MNTLHNVPKLVDGTTEQMGAEKLLGMRLADVAADVVGAYEEWCDELWEVLSADGHGTPVQTAGLSDLVITIQNGDRSNAAGKESMLVDTELVGTTRVLQRSTWRSLSHRACTLLETTLVVLPTQISSYHWENLR